MYANKSFKYCFSIQRACNDKVVLIKLCHFSLHSHFINSLIFSTALFNSSSYLVFKE
ncbi:MAG: hypothetical protein LBC61_02460 [Candidatus Peribacteria bacterium]|nr:hypothetical protein [Candidatus Peribacteria bacterium]